jgi:hypothetical protein
MTSALFGRMFATGSYCIALQYAYELFPTAIRGTAVATCEVFGSLGLFLCPQIVYLVIPIVFYIKKIKALNICQKQRTFLL